MTFYISSAGLPPLRIRTLHHYPANPRSHIPNDVRSPLDLTYQEFVDLPALPGTLAIEPIEHRPLVSTALQQQCA